MSLKSTPSVDFITKLTQHPRQCVREQRVQSLYVVFFSPPPLLSFSPPLPPELTHDGFCSFK